MEDQGEAIKSREVYFSTYQAIAKDERRPGLYKQYPRNFFDLIIVDECHRGSARGESNWREILEYFESAYQIGMTATPLREDNRDTYRYFGNPIYIYSLRQGIEDGFLAPYRVHRIVPMLMQRGGAQLRENWINMVGKYLMVYMTQMILNEFFPSKPVQRQLQNI